MDIELLREKNKEVYEKIYANEVEGMDFDGYGTANHGAGYIAKILSLEPKPKSIMDIGCGYGQFIIAMSQHPEITKAYGVDIASSRSPKNNKVIWMKAPMSKIPLPDRSVDWITSFDTLEHIPEEDIDNSMMECKRIAKVGCFHSLLCADEVQRRKVGDWPLHICIKPAGWWHKKMEKIGFIENEKLWGNRGDWLIRIS